MTNVCEDITGGVATLGHMTRKVNRLKCKTNIIKLAKTNCQYYLHIPCVTNVFKAIIGDVQTLGHMTRKLSRFRYFKKILKKNEARFQETTLCTMRE